MCAFSDQRCPVCHFVLAWSCDSSLWSWQSWQLTGCNWIRTCPHGSGHTGVVTASFVLFYLILVYCFSQVKKFLLFLQGKLFTIKTRGKLSCFKCFHAYQQITYLWLNMQSKFLFIFFFQHSPFNSLNVKHRHLKWFVPRTASNITNEIAKDNKM